MNWHRALPMVFVLLLAPSACGGSDEVSIALIVDETGHAGTFTSEGAGVCPAGTWSNVNPAPDEDIGIVPTRHQFRCGDGSGIFFLEIDAQLDGAEGRQSYRGTWTLGDDGLGDYSGATGSGTMRGSTAPTWTETYEGKLVNG